MAWCFSTHDSHLRTQRARSRRSRSSIAQAIHTVSDARAGGDVVIWGRREDRNEQAARKLRSYGARVATDVVDVADEAAQQRGFARALEQMGRLDGVIANAGFVTIAPLVDEPVTSFQHGAVVTEQGIAWMWGRSEREQARNLIEHAAHPSVRDDLWEEARGLGLA